MRLIDNAIYVEGRRSGAPVSLDDTYELLRRSSAELNDSMAWIGLYRPDAAEVRSVAAEFGLHHLAVDDALTGHQRPKLERYGDTLFVVLRPTRYLTARDTIEFGELHVFVGPQFVVTIRHAECPDLRGVRTRMEADPELLALGPEAVLYAILDRVVDEYAPVVAGLQKAVDEIEDRLFGGDPAVSRQITVSRRIYGLLREVLAFQRAVHPLGDVLEALRRGSDKYEVDPELRHTLRDVLDHVQRITSRTDAFQQLLQNALAVRATLVSQQQNDEMRRLSEASLVQAEESRRLSEIGLAQNEEIKKISSWAAILFAPTVIGTIYGMNFDFMPELHWPAGYPLAVAAMLVMGGGLYAIFKRKKWL
jgi:magnesium transporter